MKSKRHSHKITFLSFLSKISVRNLYFSLCLCVCIYTLITPFLTYILQHHGVLCKATITADESSRFHRWPPNNYLYEFRVDGKTYTGNSLIEVGNNDKIGDTITVLYFKHLLAFNRPVCFYNAK